MPNIFIWVKFPVYLGKITHMGAVQQKISGDFWKSVHQMQIKNKLSASVIAWHLLGWDSNTVKKLSSFIDVYQRINNGIPKSSVSCFSDSLDIPLTSIAVMLNMSYKTLTRKEENEMLDSAVSSHIYEIATVYAKAIEIFQDQNKVAAWFNKENKALKGEKPFGLLNTITGIKLVTQVLGRIEEGVYT